MAKTHHAQYPLWALLLFLYMLLSAGIRAQIIYVNGELLPGFAGLFKVDLATCTFCPITAMNDGNDIETTILPNGDAINFALSASNAVVECSLTDLYSTNSI